MGGVFGFPITMQDIDYQNSIKIIGFAAHNFDELNDIKATIVYKNPIRHKNDVLSNGSSVNTAPILEMNYDNKSFYTADNIMYKIKKVYCRLLGVRK